MTAVPERRRPDASRSRATRAGQQWFWAERWQQMEREADKDIATGRVTRFGDAASFLKTL